MIQKYVTMPHLVEAVQWTGENMADIMRITEGLSPCYRLDAVLYDSTRLNHSIKVGGWVVKKTLGKIALMSNEDFEAQYSPFKEELKDYPTEIINP